MDRLAITRRLIEQHSVSGVSSRPIADFASNLLSDHGFRVEQQVYYDKDGVEKVNIVAVKGGEGTPELAFSGHLDTVPFNDKEWKSDPLKLVERDGRFFGRGTCDMKGFIGIAMSIGNRIDAAHFKRPFGIILTSDEEVGCVGIRRLVEKREPLARNILIGEPTNLVPYYMHKGYIYGRVLLRDKTSAKDGHSSDPSKGRNVLTRAGEHVLRRLREMGESLEQILDERFEVPYPTLNVGVMNTGSSAGKNIIASACDIEFDVRPLPGQDVDEVVQAIRQHVCPNGEINGISVEVKLVRAPSPPFETDRNAAIVRAVESAFGNEAQSTSFNTEGGILNRSGCRCVICGPGSIDQAHRPDEFVDARYFKQDVEDTYEKIVRGFCCTEVEA